MLYPQFDVCVIQHCLMYNFSV